MIIDHTFVISKVRHFPFFALSSYFLMRTLKKIIISFWLHWVFVAGLSLVVVSEELGVLCSWLLIAVATLVAEHEL